jgi:hypothetical protein
MGSSQRLKLDLLGDDFEKGSEAEYVVVARDVGDVTKV